MTPSRTVDVAMVAIRAGMLVLTTSRPLAVPMMTQKNRTTSIARYGFIMIPSFVEMSFAQKTAAKETVAPMERSMCAVKRANIMPVAQMPMIET